MNTQRITFIIITIMTALTMWGCDRVYSNIAIDSNYVLDKQSGQGVIIFSTYSNKVWENAQFVFKSCRSIPTFSEKLLVWNSESWKTNDFLDKITFGTVRGKSSVLAPDYHDFIEYGGNNIIIGERLYTYYGKGSDDKGKGTDDIVGILHAVALPESVYNFYEFYPSFNIYPMALDWYFMANPGEVKYIGCIYLVGNRTLSPNATCHFIVTDMHERDLALFERKYPNIPVSNVKIELLKNQKEWELFQSQLKAK